MRRARYVANMTPARWRQAVEEHGEILKALEARDAGLLSRLLRVHIRNKFETVADWVRRQAGETPAA